MGLFVHHAVVATADAVFRGELERVRQVALESGLPATEIMPSPVNMLLSFFIGPDGSKEGWTDSDAGDTARADVLKLLRASGAIEWALLEYGETGARIIESSRSGDD